MSNNNNELDIIRIIHHIGDNPDREGLKETPARVVKSWKELFAGYTQDISEFITVFENEGMDDIILLKNIEMFSTCEHHMLPFYGKAHVAYIPDKKIIGISKLARIVDVFARRLQIQERIGKEVTDALNQYLKPKGAACIIEATHMCMRMRGVNKQNSKMITSDMTGAFFTSSAARMELLSLIKK